eukprot:Gb_05815 [translate_table: standard]
MQQGGLTTNATRKTPFTLVISFPLGYNQSHSHIQEQYFVRGELFLDNGEDIEMHIKAKKSTYVEFHASVMGNKVKVNSKVMHGEYALQQGWKLHKIVVLGSSSRPLNLMINGKPSLSTYTLVEDDNSVLSIFDLDLDNGKCFNLWWKI